MTSYDSPQKLIFSIFDSNNWKSEGIKVIPSNYNGDNIGNEYVRFSLLQTPGVNRNSTRGLIFFDIFVEANKGPSRSLAIVNKISSYFSGKSFTNSVGCLQFFEGSVDIGALDPVTATLFRRTFQINFNFNGVT